MDINIIPKEIIYHHIIPFSPCFDLDKNKLRLQKKRIKLYSFIIQEFYLEKKVQKEIKHYIFKKFQGQSQFCLTFLINKKQGDNFSKRIQLF